MQCLQKIATPNSKTIEEVSNYLKIPKNRLIKTLIVKGKTSPFIALALRGDHQLNILKAEKILGNFINSVNIIINSRDFFTFFLRIVILHF